MKTIALIFPSKEHEQQVLDYKNEFEMNHDSMDGTGGLKYTQSFEEWLDALRDNSTEKAVANGLVPASTYLAIRISDQKVIGMLTIRHRLNSYLFQFGGHIGYSVRKSEQGKGYAKETLFLGLEKCKINKMKKVLITCDKENTASRKVIIHNGGVLENELFERQILIQRYWIPLNMD